MSMFKISTYMSGKIIVEANSEEEAKIVAQNAIVPLKIIESKTVVEKVDDDYELEKIWRR